MKKKQRYEDINSQSVQDRPLDVHDLNKNMPSLEDSYIKLEKKCEALSETVEQLLKAIEDKEVEITELKAMLSNSSLQTVGSVVELALDDEVFIADMQLRKLKDAAKVRQLTLDEVRMFDLLVKNKRLAKGDATTIDGKSKDSIKKLSKPELLKLAAKSIKE